MTKKYHYLLLAMLFLVTISPAQAQPAKKMARIGYLAVGSEDRPMVKTVVAEFKQGLRDLGWIEGKQVRFELRYAE